MIGAENQTSLPPKSGAFAARTLRFICAMEQYQQSFACR
jgi:hypothetical protein